MARPNVFRIVDDDVQHTSLDVPQLTQCHRTSFSVGIGVERSLDGSYHTHAFGCWIAVVFFICGTINALELRLFNGGVKLCADFGSDAAESWDDF